MIIGLVGKAQSGKDTTGAYLVKEFSFERRAFADPLKKAVATLFGIPFSEIDKLKLNPAATILLYTGIAGAGHDEERIASFTFREFLKRFGTEMGREVFGEDFWVNLTLPVDGYYIGRRIVVTDCRFKNEVERIHQLGGIVLRITRPGLESDAVHRSEVEQDEIEVDDTIVNDGTINDLCRRVQDAIDMYYTSSINN